MTNENFDYEEYRNNLELAVDIHDKFYRTRNMLIYFILYSASYSFVISTWITSGFTMFVSLVAVFLLAKITTYLFDYICFAIKILRRNWKRRKKNNGKENKE